MKKYMTYLLMLIALFCITTAAAAQIEKHFDPEQDTLISCGANPADYTGMTFDGDVYVLLNGCADLKSTVIPGDNAFLTLRDIKVNGTLYFVDDTFDAAGGTYRESLTYDSLTRAHHYLNLAGNSYVENLYMECMNPHDCNLGLQYPSEINSLHIVPTNAASRGKIAVRGYIDPLVDEATDYYTDTTVSSFPEFNFETFDKDFASAIVNRYKVFEREALYVSTEAIRNGTEPETIDDYYEEFVKKYRYPQEVAATEVFLKRGKVNNLYIYNKYLIGSGDTNIDLINLIAKQAMVTNGKNIESTTATDFARAWVPVLRAGGFTNIGILSVYSPLKTDVLLATNEAMPFYIDAMVVGTEGLTEKITLKSTKIAMLNYLGGISPYSVLNLTFESPDKGLLLHIPSIGIMMAHGGKINLTSNSYYQEIFHIGTFWLLNGRDDMRYAADSNGVSSAAAILTLPAFEGNMSNKTTKGEENTVNLVEVYNDHYSYDEGEEYDRTLAQSTSSVGAKWIANMLDEYSVPAPDDIKQASTTKIVLHGISFGDLKIDKELDKATNTGWFSASCAVHQYGERSSAAPSIEFVVR